MAQTTTIRNLLVRLGLDADDRGAVAFDKTIQGVKKTLLAVVAAAGAVGAALLVMVRSTARAGDEASQMATSLNITVEAAQELSYAFERFGADGADVSDVFNTLTDRAEDAKSGMQSFIDDFALIGIEVADLKDKSPEQLFYDFADAVGETENANRRNSAVVRLLGDDLGRKLIPLLSEGSAGIEEFTSQARALGVVMSEDGVEAGREFQSSMVAIQGILKGIRNLIGLSVMPTITNAANRFTDWYIINGKIVRQAIDQVFEKVAAAMRLVVSRGRELITQIDSLVKRTVGWDTTLSTVAATIATIGALKTWALLVGAVKIVIAIVGVLSIKIIAIAALFAGLVLVVQDLITYFRGGESVTEKLIERFNELGVIETVNGWVAGLVAVVQDLWAAFMDSRAGRLIAIVREFWGVLKKNLAPVLEQVAGLASVMWEAYSLYMQLIFAIFSKIARKVFDVWFREVNKIAAVAGTAFRLIADVTMWWWENITLPIFRALAPLVIGTLTQVVEFFKIAFASIRDVLEFFLALVNGEFYSFGEVVEAALGVVGAHFERFGDFFLGIIQDRVQMMRETFQGAFDWIMSKIEAITGHFDNARDALSRVPGLGFLGGDAGASDDVAVGRRQEAQRNVALAASFGGDTIEINGATADPAALADEIAARQEGSFQRRLREASAAFGGGEL